MGRLWNLQEVEPCRRKYITGSSWVHAIALTISLLMCETEVCSLSFLHLLSCAICHDGHLAPLEP